MLQKTNSPLLGLNLTNLVHHRLSFLVPLFSGYRIGEVPFLCSQRREDRRVNCDNDKPAIWYVEFHIIVFSVVFGI